VRRAAPRPLARALGPLTDAWAPATLLGDVQRVWAAAVGSAVAAEASPVRERAGVVELSCRSAVWAQELDLMSAEVVSRLNSALGSDRVRGLRCTAAPPRRAP
jgi:predicted nucleic acid-binding Zn ribbon protein